MMDSVDLNPPKKLLVIPIDILFYYIYYIFYEKNLLVSYETKRPSVHVFRKIALVHEFLKL